MRTARDDRGRSRCHTSGSTQTFARSPLSGQALRFVLLGGANTLVTAAAFYALATVVSARIAFTIVYAAGLVFVVAATPRVVFGSRASWSRRLLLAVWYMATYAVGIGVISVLTSAVSAGRLLVVLATVAVTAPLSFAGGRLLVGEDSGSGPRYRDAR